MFHFDRDFVDKNGERMMLPIRVRSTLRILEEQYVIRTVTRSGDFDFCLGDYTFDELEDKADWTQFIAGRSIWGEPDQWAWFKQVVEIPVSYSGQDVWYQVNAHTTSDGAWHWGHPQAQLFVNGECVSGIDSHHRRYLLAKNAKGGEKYEIAVKVYSDLTYYNGPLTFSADLIVMRPAVYELYQSMVVPLKAVALMSSDSIERVEIIKALNQAVTILAMGANPDSEEFNSSIREAQDHLNAHLYGTLRSGAEPTLWAFGHTHIDVAWQWTYHVSRNKAARSFATNIRLLEENPDYLFMSSQPVLYEFVKQDQPRLYEKIKSNVAQGRWEPEGGMYVEADTNLTGGESLVRQFLVGKRFFKEEFGVNCKVLWLPDVFGYSGNLPQICQRSGVPYFYTTKIGWNEYTKFPYDTFRWRGIDGSSVLAHFGCAINYADIETDWMTTYNPSLDPTYVLGAWKRYQQKDLNRDLLFDFGYGDGGGGPTQEMIDYGRRLKAGIPGCPSLKFAKVKDFYTQLDKEVSDQPHLPEWLGEMYLEFHRGTYTSQAKTKKNNRKSEQLYHDTENLNSFALLFGSGLSYPVNELRENWKLILLNQFHDVLPGSSIHKVYEEVDQIYDGVLRCGKQMRDAAIDSIAAMIQTQQGCIAVFNTLSFERSPIVIYDGCITGLRDTDGVNVPVQKTYDGKSVFIAPRIPSKGWKTFAMTDYVKEEEIDCTIKVSHSYIETASLRVTFDEKMHITSLFSKLAGRETLPAGTTAGRIIAYDDVAKGDDNWNVQAYYREKGHIIDNVTKVEVLEKGPVRALVRVTRAFRNSIIQTDIIAYADSDVLRFDYEIEWNEHNLFVKAEYPVDVNANEASYEIQFGFVKRPTHMNTLADFARFEVCGHKYADLSDGGFGLSIINDCKYGYNATRKMLSISLLKCSTYPDKTCDIGHHSFSYALFPHGGDMITARTRDHAYDFNFEPLAKVIPAQKGSLPATVSLFSVDKSNIVIETIKKAEDSDDIILRIYEAENKKTECTLQSYFRIDYAGQTNLLEEHESDLPFTESAVKLSFAPFEIKTILLRVV